MLEQLLINNDFETIILISMIVLLVLIVAMSLGFGFTALFLDNDMFLGICAILVTIIGISGGYMAITQLNKQANQIKTIQKGHVEDYYNLTKDGKAITFKLKESKSEYLQKQAEAKIIDEDNKTYQIQYKETIDRVPKSAVK